MEELTSGKAGQGETEPIARNETIITLINRSYFAHVQSNCLTCWRWPSGGAPMQSRPLSGCVWQASCNGFAWVSISSAAQMRLRRLGNTFNWAKLLDYASCFYFCLCCCRCCCPSALVWQARANSSLPNNKVRGKMRGTNGKVDQLCAFD